VTARHFGPGFVSFFRGLGRRNTRLWFHAHRTEYERNVKGPFAEFVEEMIERVAALDPHMRCEAREAIFRIARDTRFSADKTPYKTHVSAVIGPGGRKTRIPAFYLQLGTGGLGIAAGLYQPDRDQLYRVREAIRDGGTTLVRLLGKRSFRAVWGELQGERNARLPREFAEAAPRFPLLYHKQFYCWAEYAGSVPLLRRDLADFLMHHYRAARPALAWLRSAVVSRLPGRR
jgi:uncharacterized protein (TIGR02453 family)